MNTTLDGRTALVTGSTRGIGFAIARALLDQGARVIVHGRDAETVKHAADRLDAGERVETAVADLGTEEGTDQLIAQVVNGPLDILVNNAAILRCDGMTPRAECLEFFEVNALAGMQLAQVLLPLIIRQDDDGRLIWISSEAALMPSAKMLPYAMSKAAQLVLSMCFAEMAAGTSVTSNTVVVGPTRTEGADAFLNEARVTWPEVMAGYPATKLGRPSEAEEIAAFVAWLASPASSAMRGAAVRVDGGVIPTIV